MLMVSKIKAIEATCPLSGSYQLSNLSNFSLLSPCSSPSTVTLEAGCGTTSLKVKSQCQQYERQDTQFSCHSHWREGTTTKVLLSKKDSQQIFCLSYSEKSGSVSQHSCHPDTETWFNMTETGQCLQALSSVSSADQSTCKISMLHLIVVSVVSFIFKTSR